jgi:hypothetical protein
LFLFITFAMSFHILYKADNKNNFVTDDSIEISKSITSHLRSIPFASRKAENISREVNETQESFIEQLKTLPATREILEHNITSINTTLLFEPEFVRFGRKLVSSFKSSGIEDHNEKFFDNYDRTFHLEMVKEILEKDDDRLQLEKIVDEHQQVAQNFSKSIQKFHEVYLNIVELAIDTSILKLGNTCEIKFNETHRFFKSIAEVKKTKEMKTMSLCAASEESRMEIVKSALNRVVTGNPFVLCNSTIKNIDDLFKTVSPLKLIETSRFETFCSLNEEPQKDILFNTLGFKAYWFDRVKQFCQSDKKTSELALKSFYDLDGFNFTNQESFCSEDKSVANKYWMKFKTKFNLKDADQHQFLKFCSYEENFLYWVFYAPFTKKFPETTEMKQLCFIRKNLREEVIMNGFVKIESVEGIEESIENLNFNSDCDIKLSEDEKAISSFESESSNALIDSKDLCKLALDLGVDGINQLYLIDPADVLLLVELCQANVEYLRQWFHFFRFEMGLETYTDMCYINYEFRDAIFKANSIVVDLEWHSYICQIYGLIPSESEEETRKFEPSSSFVPKLLEDSFEINDICQLSFIVHDDILKTIFNDTELCNLKYDADYDSNLDLEDLYKSSWKPEETKNDQLNL